MTKIKEIEIDYMPREWAKPFHEICNLTDENKVRLAILCLHRRAGKTVASLNHLQRDALQIPKSRFAYIAPTYTQAKNIAWDLLKGFAREIPGVAFNEAELRVDYPNGSRLRLYGADNPDSLRGIGLWGVVFDEYEQQPGNIFGEIISKALADHLGYAIFIGTIKGRGKMFRMYENAKGREDWFSEWKTIDDSLQNEKGITIDNLRIALEDDRKLIEQGIMSQEEFDQEWYLSTDAAIRGAYYSKQLAEARQEGRIGRVPYEHSLPVHTWWDLGIADAMSIGFFQNVGSEWRMIDYVEHSGEGLKYYIDLLKDKGYTYGEHFAPHDIQVRELTSGKSRIEIAESLGIKFEIAPNLQVEDGINAVRSRFNTLWMDEEKCQIFIDAIAQYRKDWDEKHDIYKRKPIHDWTAHAADMIRYWAVTNQERQKESVVQYRPKWSGYSRGVNKPSNEQQLFPKKN